MELKNEKVVIKAEKPAKAPKEDALAQAKARVRNARYALLGNAQGPAETRDGLLSRIITLSGNDHSFINFNNALIKLVGGDTLGPKAQSIHETAKVNTLAPPGLGEAINKIFHALGEDFNIKLQGKHRDKLLNQADPNKKKKNLLEAAGAAFIELQRAYTELARVQIQHNSYERSKKPILTKNANVKAGEGSVINPEATMVSDLLISGDKLITGSLSVQITGNTMTTTNYEPGMDVTAFARMAFEAVMKSQNQTAVVGGTALQGVRDILKNYNKWGLTTGVSLKQDTQAKMKQGRFRSAKEQQRMGEGLYSKNKKFADEIETYMDILNNVPNNTLNLVSTDRLSKGQRDGMNMANIHYSLETEGLKPKAIEKRVIKATKTMIQDRYGKNDYQENPEARAEDAAEFFETVNKAPIKMTIEQFSDMLPDDLKNGFGKALASKSQSAEKVDDLVMMENNTPRGGPGNK